MRGKIICPKCGEIGRLEPQSKDKFRINHDKMKDGVMYAQRCYLGSLSKSIKNLINTSETRPDILEKLLVEELESYFNVRSDILNEIKDSPYATLIARTIQLSQHLGYGWSKVRHRLVKQDNCPYCKKRISVKFIRIGENPDYNKGKYNIADLKIEKGKKSHTSYFGNKNSFRQNWVDGIYKDKSKITSGTYTEELETIQEKKIKELRFKILNHIIHNRS